MKKVVLYPHNTVGAYHINQFKDLLPFNVICSVDVNEEAIKAYTHISEVNGEDIKTFSDLKNLVDYAEAVLFINTETLDIKDKENSNQILETFESLGLKICNLSDFFKTDTNRQLNSPNLVSLHSCGEGIDTLSVQLSIALELRQKGYYVNVRNCSYFESLVPQYEKPDLTISSGEAGDINLLITSKGVSGNELYESINKLNPTALIIMDGGCIPDVNIAETPVFNFAADSHKSKLNDLLRNELLKKISISKLLQRDREAFIEKDKNQFYRFEIGGKQFLFESNSRLCWSIDKDVYSFLDIYFDGNNALIDQAIKRYGYESIISKFETFNTMRFGSRIQGQKINVRLSIEPELHTGETIFSFLGKRKCNLRCRYCFVDETKVEGREEELTPEMMRAGFDFILQRNQNSYRVRADYSLGGEPMLTFETYKQLWAISKEYDSRSDMEVALGFVTNGTLLSDEAIEWFNQNHHWIGFSLDGGKEVHDSMRVFHDGRGTFDKAIGQIRKVLDLNWEHDPGVNVVLTAKNPDILKIFLELWDLGFRVITAKPVRASSDLDFAITMKNINVIKEAYIRFADFLIEKAKEGKLEYLKAILNPFDFFGRFLMRVFMRDRIFLKRCAGGTKIFSMRNNGDLYPCDSFNGIDAFKLGNVREKTFDPTVFQVPAVDEVDTCKDCWARYLCGGVCRYTLYINDGKQDSASEAECELQRHLIMLSCYLWSEIKSSLPEEEVSSIREHILIQTGGATW
ncbi:MAG: SPASM domain-containing protein [Clostridia bacterium]|nr:SPASM domain-containing protein [Clostridia bacterium]